MKTISRYIMTLALLLTAASGAWAEETLLLTINSRDYESFYSGSKTFDDKVTVTFSNEVYNAGDEWGWYTIMDSPSLLTVAGINGYTITSCKFYTENGIAKTGYTVEGESPSVYLSSMQVYTDDSKSVSIGSYGVTKIEVFGAAAPAEPDVEVTTNAASEGATFTEASFQMPAFDATAEYELVRDMSIQMTAQVGDGTQEQPRYRVKKDGNNKFIPADMEMAAVPALFTVNDAIEQKALTQTQDYIVQIYAIDAEGQPTGDPMTFATFTFEPGIYAVKAVAADGSDYDGETALSNTFKLFQGYEVTVPAGEYVTYYRTDDNLKLDDEPTGGKLYTITAVAGETATATEIASANKEMPFLVFNGNTETKTFLLIPTDDVTNQTFFEGFIGTTEATTIAASDASADRYALNGLQFVWVKDAIAITANKAWLEVSNGPVAGAKALTIVFGEATGVIEVKEVIEVKDDSFYDLNGRKLQGIPTKKGIYIFNGKKVMVK